MIQLHDVSLRRGRRVLFQNASFMVPPGAKLGIVGRNGTGKSSLLALLTGELHLDQGNLDLPVGAVLAHVSQETPDTAQPAIEYVIDGDRPLRAVERALAEAESAGDGHRLAVLHAELEALGGYTAPTRAARLLHGLGFAPQDDRRPVNEFSGGWRMRLNLAQALMCRSDLLLLDEPTNHLDMEAVIWLERWLKSYAGTLLLIAHDQAFLESVVDHVVHLDGSTARLYRGSFESFERQYADERARHAVLYERQQREIKRIRGFVDRFRAKASKARQAQSRLKALARMDLIAAAHADATVHFEFPAPAKLPNPLVKFERVAVGYDDKQVLADINLSLRPGMRVGLLGVNGAGKSTLVKLMAEQLAPSGGHYEPMPGLQTGYFAQHQLETLDAEASPLVCLRRLSPQTPDQRLKDYLGGFDFGGERVGFPTGQLSGGEKARLALALIIWQAPNLLLLDEPTNHLDLEMRHALSVALQEFEGALVLVSHDRHLLRTVTDELWLVDGGRVRSFDGDVDDYQRRSEAVAEPAEEPSVQQSVSPAPATSRAQRAQQRREQARQREQRRPLTDRLKRLERSIDKTTAERKSLDEELTDNTIYDPEHKERLKALMFDRARLDADLQQLEEEWLTLQASLEAMQ